MMTDEERVSARLMGRGLHIAKQYLEKAKSANADPNLASAIEAILLHIEEQEREASHARLQREIGNF